MTILDPSGLPSEYRGPFNRRYTLASAKAAAKPDVASGAANVPATVPSSPSSSSSSSSSSSPGSAKSVADLSPDVLASIFSHSSFADIRAIRCVNRDFRRAASDPAPLHKELARAGLRLPSGSDDAISSWTKGLRHLHIQKNLERGRYVYGKVSRTDATDLYPPDPTSVGERELRLFKQGLPPFFADGASHDRSLFAYLPFPVHPGTVHLVDMTHPAKQEKRFQCPGVKGGDPAFSRDHQRFAVTTFNGEAVTWNLQDGTETRFLCCDDLQRVTALALSSDGGKLAAVAHSSGWLHDIKWASNLAAARQYTASALKRTWRRKDNVVRVFDLTVSPPRKIFETWVSLGVIGGNELDFTPDDSRLLCKNFASANVRVWDFESPGTQP